MLEAADGVLMSATDLQALLPASHLSFGPSQDSQHQAGRPGGGPPPRIWATPPNPARASTTRWRSCPGPARPRCCCPPHCTTPGTQGLVPAGSLCRSGPGGPLLSRDLQQRTGLHCSLPVEGTPAAVPGCAYLCEFPRLDAGGAALCSCSIPPIRSATSPSPTGLS